MIAVTDDLRQEVDSLSEQLIQQLYGKDLPTSVIAVFNCAAALIKQLPEEHQDAAMEESVRMFMGFMGYEELPDDPDYATATKH